MMCVVVATAQLPLTAHSLASLVRPQISDIEEAVAPWKKKLKAARDRAAALERERDEAAAALEREQEACAGWQQEVCDRDANALRLQGVIR